MRQRMRMGAKRRRTKATSKASKTSVNEIDQAPHGYQIQYLALWHMLIVATLTL